jgi:hypothetical protein
LFRPVHKKKFGKFGKSSANFTKTSMQSFAPFLPILGTFGQFYFFFSAPFELFGRNFGHLATLHHSWRDGGVGGPLGSTHRIFPKLLRYTQLHDVLAMKAWLK